MSTVLLVLHIFVTLMLIGLVLIQRSEGGGLGIGSTPGMGSFMGGRGTANLLTRATAILGTVFFILSLALALINRSTAGPGRSLLDQRPPAATGTAIPGPATGGPATGAPAPGLPTLPAGPSVPTR